MPRPSTVGDNLFGPFHFKQVSGVSLSDGDSDTTAKMPAGGLSVFSSEWAYAQQPADRVASPPQKVEQPQEADPSECYAYLKGKCANGENCPLKHFGYDSNGAKKQVCLGFMKGHCTYGLKCKFLHHAFDPATQTYREACMQHANYKCTRGDECPFLHGPSRRKNKNELPRSRGTAPSRQEAKYSAEQASIGRNWIAPPQESRSERVQNRMAVQREVLEGRAEILLIRLNCPVGIDEVLGMLSWCGMDPHMYDIVFPPAVAHEPGFIRFTAPEYAARFVEACDLPGSMCSPTLQDLPVLLETFAERLPPNQDDPYVFLFRDNGRNVMHLKLLELLGMLRRELISTSSSPEKGRVISEPRLKDSLNQPRFGAYGDGPLKQPDWGRPSRRAPRLAN